MDFSSYQNQIKFKSISTTDSNRFFVKDGIPFRFVGANTYELAHVDSETASRIIEDSSKEGFTVLRFWCFEPVKKENLNEIFRTAKKFSIKLIPVLADMTGYLQSYSISGDWFREDYKESFLKHACDMVTTYSNSEEVLLWELINEPYSNSFNDFYNFAADVSGELKSIARDQLFSVGTIGGIGDRFGSSFSRFNVKNFEKLYSIKTLDALSIHDYSFDSTLFERLDIFYRLNGRSSIAGLMKGISGVINFIPSVMDRFTINNFGDTFDFPLTIRNLWRSFIEKNIEIAARLGKPLYIGEIGFKKNLGKNRKKILELNLKKYFELGVAGILLWSFESQRKSLDGHDYGFDSGEEFGKIIRY